MLSKRNNGATGIFKAADWLVKLVLAITATYLIAVVATTIIGGLLYTISGNIGIAAIAEFLMQAAQPVASVGVILLVPALIVKGFRRITSRQS